MGVCGMCRCFYCANTSGKLYKLEDMVLCRECLELYRKNVVQCEKCGRWVGKFYRIYKKRYCCTCLGEFEIIQEE